MGRRQEGNTRSMFFNRERACAAIKNVRTYTNTRRRWTIDPLSAMEYGIASSSYVIPRGAQACSELIVDEQSTVAGQTNVTVTVPPQSVAWSGHRLCFVNFAGYVCCSTSVGPSSACGPPYRTIVDGKGFPEARGGIPRIETARPTVGQRFQADAGRCTEPQQGDRELCS